MESLSDLGPIALGAAVLLFVVLLLRSSRRPVQWEAKTIYDPLTQKVEYSEFYYEAGKWSAYFKDKGEEWVYASVSRNGTTGVNARFKTVHEARTWCEEQIALGKQRLKALERGG